MTRRQARTEEGTGGQRPRLTRERITEAALFLVDRDGLDALSMRRLGRELGVEAMSLYEHVANKDDILDGLLDVLFSRIELPPTDGREWDDVARALFLAFRREFLRHPKAVPLLATRSARSATSLAPIEMSLGILRRAGFTRQGAVDAHRVLMSFTIGYLQSEAAVAADPEAVPHSWGTAAYALLDLPAADVPYLAELANVALERDVDQQFDWCLAVILTGLRAAHPYAGDGDGPACGL